jgi:hypothetical protein
MNTTTNPSQRAKQELLLTAGTEPPSRDHTSSVDAAYATAPGAEHRTFELTVASAYDMWLLTTFTGYAGEDLWVSSFTSFQPIEMKLTYRQGTLELPEVRWLADRIFESRLGGSTLQSAAGEVPSATDNSPRPHVLAEFAEQVHKYLDAYDVVEMVKDVSSITDRSYFDVAARAVPCPSKDLAAFELHLLRCVDCIRLTYIDDFYLR